MECDYTLEINKLTIQINFRIKKILEHQACL